MRRNLVEFIYNGKDACPLCDEKSSFQSFFSSKKLVHGVSNDYLFSINIVGCPNCRHVFLNPIPDEDQLLLYYSDCFPKNTSGCFFYDEKKRIALLEGVLKEGDTYCEIGSNANSLVDKYISLKAKKVIMIEPNEQCRSDVPDLDSVHPNSIDVFAAFGVLEHLINVRGFIQTLKTKLKSGAQVIVEVPNVDEYDHNFTNLLFWEHVHHFSRENLVSLFEEVGFRATSWSRSCSAPLCMLATFELVADGDEAFLQNRDLTFQSVRNGVEKIRTFQQCLNEICESIQRRANKNQATIIYGANEITSYLIGSLAESDNVIIIDDDRSKKHMFSGFECLPAVEIDGFLRSRNLVVDYAIFSSHHLSSVFWKNLQGTSLIESGHIEIDVLDYKFDPFFYRFNQGSLT